MEKSLLTVYMASSFQGSAETCSLALCVHVRLRWKHVDVGPTSGLSEGGHITGPDPTGTHIGGDITGHNEGEFTAPLTTVPPQESLTRGFITHLSQMLLTSIRKRQ